MSYSIIHLFCRRDKEEGEMSDDFDEYVTTDALNENSGEFLLVFKGGKGRAYNWYSFLFQVICLFQI